LITTICVVCSHFWAIQFPPLDCKKVSFTLWHLINDRLGSPDVPLVFSDTNDNPILYGFTASHAEPLRQLTDSLPAQVNGWTFEGEDRFFDDKTIFDYIDGEGEVYRAY